MLVDATPVCQCRSSTGMENNSMVSTGHADRSIKQTRDTVEKC